MYSIEGKNAAGAIARSARTAKEALAVVGQMRAGGIQVVCSRHDGASYSVEELERIVASVDVRRV